MTPEVEAEAVAREYMLYRLVHSGWGLFRILDEEGIGHGDVLTEREVVRLLAERWERGSYNASPRRPTRRQAAPMVEARAA